MYDDTPEGIVYFDSTNNNTAAANTTEECLFCRQPLHKTKVLSEKSKKLLAKMRTEARKLGMDRAEFMGLVPALEHSNLDELLGLEEEEKEEDIVKNTEERSAGETKTREGDREQGKAVSGGASEAGVTGSKSSTTTSRATGVGLGKGGETASSAVAENGAEKEENGETVCAGGKGGQTAAEGGGGGSGGNRRDTVAPVGGKGGNQLQNVQDEEDAAFDFGDSMLKSVHQGGKEKKNLKEKKKPPRKLSVCFCSPCNVYMIYLPFFCFRYRKPFFHASRTFVNTTAFPASFTTFATTVTTNNL